MAVEKNEFQIEEALFKKGALVIRAINHKLRQQIMQAIHKKGRVAVTDIYVKLRLEQSVASQHLAILRNGGFVKTEREGKQIFYSVNYEKVQEVQRLADTIIQTSK